MPFYSGWEERGLRFKWTMPKPVFVQLAGYVTGTSYDMTGRIWHGNINDETEKSYKRTVNLLICHIDLHHL